VALKFLLRVESVEVSENGNLLTLKVTKGGISLVLSLKANGYFRNEMSGSKTHSELLNKAKSYFKQTVSLEENYNGKFYNKSIKSKILKLLKNLDVEAGNF